MIRPRSLASLASAGVIASAAAALPVWWRWAPAGRGRPSIDLYGFIIPNWIYARQSLALGHGLLWNSFQNCGQPFFAEIQSGLLYPFHVLFFLFDPIAAMLGVTGLNLLVAGAGAFLLGRQIGLNRIGALCAALAFQLSFVTYALMIWMPTVTLAAYTWLPAALYGCERTLARPSARSGVLLGAVLALQFLSGFPQTSLFTYQLIVLRLVWELFTVPRPGRPRMIGAVVFGLALGIGLSAVQMVPASEVAALSLRSAPLPAREVVLAPLGWRELADEIRQRQGIHPFALLPCLLVAVGMIAGRRRRVPLFYLLAALTYAALVVTPLLDLYLMLPVVGRLFREPRKFLWLTTFALSVPVGYGAHVITQRAEEPARQRRRVAAAALAAAAVWLLAMAPRPSAAEWVMIFGIVGIAFVGCGRASAVVAGLLAPLLAWNLFSVLSPPPGLERSATYYDEAALFRSLASAAPMQRFNLIESTFDLEPDLAIKTASVLRVPFTRDYGPLTSRRYGELLLRMNRNRKRAAGSSITLFTFFEGKPPANRPLANLTGLRFLVLNGETERAYQRWHSYSGVTREDLERAAQADRERMRALSFVERERYGDVTVWENPTALPRAYYVPRLEVVESPSDLLERLAADGHDPRRTVLVERLPDDGYRGEAAAPARDGQVRRFEDRGETLTVEVQAPQGGFLFVADQYYPGWEAEVNSAPAEPLRANYAFRAVRIPAGESTVVFRYRPWSLHAGVLISTIASFIAVALIALRR